MKDFIANIEKTIGELEARFKTNSDFISQTAQAIEKLATDKLNAVKDSDIVNGAIQAYRNVVAEGKRLLQDGGDVVTSVETLTEDIKKAADELSNHDQKSE